MIENIIHEILTVYLRSKAPYDMFVSKYNLSDFPNLSYGGKCRFAYSFEDK